MGSERSFPRQCSGCVVVLSAAFLLLSLSTPLAHAQRSPAAIEVRVGDAVREQPLTMAEVRLTVFGHPTPVHSAFTDGSGRVLFSAVQHGSYYLEVEKSGYLTLRENLEVSPGANQSVTVSLHAKPPEAAAKPAGVVSAAMLAEGPARKEYDLGIASMRANPAESVQHFRKAVEVSPNFPEALALLGMAYLREGKSAEAFASVERANELNPAYATAKLLRGKLYLEKKDYARAEADLLENVRLDPGSWYGYQELARCYFRVGKFDRALEAALKARALPHAPPSTRLLLADILLRMGDTPSALRELEQFAKEDPHNPLVPKLEAKIQELRKQAHP